MGFHSPAFRRTYAVAAIIAATFAVALQSGPANASAFTYRDVSTGYHRTCAVTSEGAGLCWGWNYSSSLGTSDTSTTVFIPSLVRLPAGETFRRIEAGSYFMSCGLTVAGNVYCWGEGGIVSRVPLPADTKVTQLSVGATQGCVITEDSRLYCWGDWSSGELGVGDIEPTNLPVRVFLPDAAAAAQVAAGVGFTCATTTVGAAYCWGVNGDGQLGNGNSATSKVPVRVALPVGVSVVSITAGLERACAVDTNGGGWCWGRNYSGAFGDDTYANSRTPRPVALPSGTTLTALQTGWYHTCAITTIGTTLCWGENGSGSLGTGSSFGGKTIRTAALPVDVSAADLSTGLGSTCITSTSGEVFCWGANLRGSIGTGTTVSAFSPTRILPVGTPDAVEPTSSDIGTHGSTVSGSFVANGAQATAAILLSDNTNFDNARIVPVPLPRSAQSSVAQLFSPINYSVSIRDLRPAVRYYVKARITSILGTTTTSAFAFDTLGGPPSVASTVARGISGDSAIIDAVVNANHLDTNATLTLSTDQGFSRNVRSITLGTASGVGNTSLSVDIDSLLPRTNYWARVSAGNEVDTTVGDPISFTTIGDSPTISGIELTGSRRSGTVAVQFSTGSLRTTVSVAHRAHGTRNPWKVSTRTVPANNPASAFVAIDNLDPATPYDVEVSVSNALGNIERTGLSFTTLGGAPLVDAPRAIDVGDNTVTLRSAIDANDFATRVTLQIDTDASFKNFDEWFAGNVRLGEPTTISLDVSELVDSTTYYARFVAVNAKGTTVGDAVMFTTTTPVGKLLKRRVNPVDPEPIVTPTPEIIDLPIIGNQIRLAPLAKPFKPSNAVKASAIKSPATKSSRPIRPGRRTPLPRQQQLLPR
ncbi:MAG: hypothetical protein RJB08_1023 [Actinomycetota bacterium]